MRRTAIFLLVLTLATTTGCSSQTPGGSRVIVLSYNMHHIADLEQVAAAIKKSNADFVALQEVDRKTKRSGEVDQAAELGRLTGMSATFGPAMSLDGGEFGNAILSRGGFKNFMTHTLPYHAEARREPRSAQAAKCQTPDGRKALVLISSELNWSGGDGERVEQAAALSALFIREDQAPMVLAGDMNCARDSQPIELLKRTWTEATAKIDTRGEYVFVKPELRWRVAEAKPVGNSAVRVVLEVLTEPKKSEDQLGQDISPRDR